MIQYLGDCDKCHKLGLLTRYRTDGESDLCRSCRADEEYKKLKEVKENGEA